jgi:hypothetical protein
MTRARQRRPFRPGRHCLSDWWPVRHRPGSADITTPRSCAWAIATAAPSPAISIAAVKCPPKQLRPDRPTLQSCRRPIVFARLMFPPKKRGQYVIIPLVCRQSMRNGKEAVEKDQAAHGVHFLLFQGGSRV